LDYDPLGDYVTGSWETQGHSSQVGYWFDMPPTTEEAIRQATPSAVTGMAKQSVCIRSDVDSGTMPWVRTTAKWQLGLSSSSGEGAEQSLNFYPMAQVPGSLLWATDDMAEMAKRMTTTAAMDIKVTVVRYTGMSTAASIMYDDHLYLAVDPQASGPLAPSRTAPVGVNTRLLDEIIDVQSRTPAVTLEREASKHEKGIFGDIFSIATGALGPMLNGLFGGNIGNMIGQYGPTIGGMIPF